MSQNLNDKVDKIVEDVGDLKVAVAKLDVSHDKTNSILERITDSVEYHIKRSDKLEELVALIKEEHIQLKNNQDATEKKIEAKTESIKLVMYVLATVGAIFLGLNELGIIQKLFQ
jgi:hypothetical protein